VVVVLGLAQLLLPSLAAQRVRSKIARYGVVHSTSVSAFPAIELLWGKAQSATVNAAHLDITQTAVNELLWESRGVERIDMHAESMHIGSLMLRDVSWRKRGDRLELSGRLTEADLRSAFPGATSFALLSSNSEGVSMRVGGSLFGFAGSIAVQLRAVEGKLVAMPQEIPFAGLVKVTLFSASHMYVQSFGLTESPPGGAASYQVNVHARLQ
jgi:LmeA-like phospholipid-binding